MTLHTQIGDEYLPENIAVPNQLTSFYESYVLIPNLGPLHYSLLYNKLKKIVNDFSSTYFIIEGATVFNKKYNEIPSTPFIPDLVCYAGASERETPVKIEFNIEEAYLRPNTLQPSVVLESLKNVGFENIKSSPVNKENNTENNRLEDYKIILSEFSKKNTVVTSMVNSNLMLCDDGIVSKELLTANKKNQVEIMVNSIAKSRGRAEISPDIVNLGKSMTEMILKDTELYEYQDSISKLLDIRIKNFFDKFEIVYPADFIKIVESCEWAFVRKERISLDLMKPLFRGPLGINCVAPQSQLKLIETESRMRTSVSQTLLKSRDDLKIYNNISSEVKNKLGTLFDYGSNLGQTMSEEGYSHDSMQSEKRSRVESALREISQQNSSFTLTSETLSSSVIKEYKTKGKDLKFATSELSFETFCPVEANHYLEDIGAVWCPRIKNPFLGLRNHLNEYYFQTYSDYILENYVIDPMEPVPSFGDFSRVAKDTDAESSSGTYSKKVRFALTNNDIKAGYFLGEDIQLEFNQHSDWYENSYDEDDRWMKITHIDRHGGDSMVDVTVKYHVDNVTGNDPDRTWITVSIDKYKETETYRQERLQYQQTVTKTNPARRNAIKVQAKKYASLKRDELIRKYEKNIEVLQDFAFSSLIKKMFDNNIVDGNWSYYQGIIRSCIDWEKSRMDPEPCDIESLYVNELSPYHFLNVPAVRFFLTIKKDAETIFFDTMRKVVDPNWKSLFDKVEDYVKKQRNKFNSLPKEKRHLDNYFTELILGRHLEAVLSSKTFSE